MKFARKYLLALSIALVAAFIAVSMASQSPQAQNGAVAADREEIESIIRSYLLENPQVIIDALENYRTNMEQMEQQRISQTLSDLPADLAALGAPTAGNPDGDVMIVEFFDYNCGYCVRAAEAVQQLLDTDDNIKVTFIEYPILSESSRDAARYALAADKQGQYFAYHMAVMTRPGAKSVSNLERIAADLGLDVDKLRADADSDAVSQTLAKNMELARKIGVRGTPAFVIGDRFAPGYMPFNAMKDMIDTIRAQR